MNLMPWNRRDRRRPDPLRTALKSAGVRMWTLDLDSEIIEWHEGEPSVFAPSPGQRHEPLENYLGRLHAADRDRLRRAIARAIEGRPVDFDHRVWCHDGMLRRAQLLGDVERDGSGVAHTLHALVVDRTDHYRALEALQAVAAVGSAGGDEAPLQSMVAYLAGILRVDHALIGEVTDAGTIQTLAVYSKGTLAANFEYQLAGTPCAEIGQSPVCYFPSRVAQLFPEDRLLTEMGVDAYLGAPLLDRAGQLIGIMAVLHGGPIESPDTAKALVSLLASRASAELHRQHASDALARRTLLLQSVLTSISDGVIVCDAAGRFTHANPAGRAMLGWTDAEASADAPAAVAGGTFTPLARALRGESVRDQLIRSQSKLDRGAQWLSVTAGPIVQNGQPNGAVAVLRDVSTQRRAEENLKRSEQRYRQLFDQSQITFIIDRDGQLVDVNRAAAELFGRTREHLVGTIGFALIAPESQADARAALADAAAGGDAVSVDLDVTTATGDRRSLLCLCSSLQLAGGAPASAVLVTAVDITDRKKAEADRARLEARTQQMYKMEAVGQLAGGVAHDFNNLLQAIQGYLHFALDQLQEHDPVRQRIIDAVRASDRAAELTRRLLAFSRQETQERRVFDPAASISETGKLVRRLIGEHIDLQVTCEPQAWAVEADAGQHEQILLNLCLNARDAMPSGGHIMVTVRNRMLEAAAERLKAGQYVEIAVADSGVGIPESIRAKIFEPFFTTKPMGQGTGLGLATVYAIVEGLRGAIELDSEVGRGTTFRILLPATGDVEREQIAPIVPPLTMGGHETLLVAEDEDLVRELTVEMLEGAGYRVVVAKDGVEAMELYDRHASEIRLALLDVVMPRAGGYDVIAHIRRHNPDLPAVFASGYGFDARDSTPVIQKPYSRVELLRRLRVMLDAATPAVTA